MNGKNEAEEFWALRLVGNGNGSWPLQEHPRYDEACVSYTLESPDLVHVFLRKAGQTLQQYGFQLVPAPPCDTEALKEVGSLPKAPRPKARRRDFNGRGPALRFLADSIEVAAHLDRTEQSEVLAYALDHLLNTGQLDAVNLKLLNRFLDRFLVAKSD